MTLWESRDFPVLNHLAEHTRPWTAFGLRVAETSPSRNCPR